MHKLSLFVTAAAVMALFACNGQSTTTQKEEKTQSASHEAMDMSSGETGVKMIQASFTNQDEGVRTYMKGLSARYMDLKEALVATDAGKAAAAAGKLDAAIKGFDKSLLSMEQKKVYDAQESAIKSAATQISGTQDVEKQRAAFSTLSEHYYELAKSFGAGHPLYYAYCPMALGHAGARWLSETEKIRNPYFGDKMMGCGSVEAMIH